LKIVGATSPMSAFRGQLSCGILKRIVFNSFASAT
jgi:hypothetical protein